MNTLTLDIQKEKRTYDYNNDFDFISALAFIDEDKVDIFKQSNTEVSNVWDLNIDLDGKIIKSYLLYLKKWNNYSALNNLFGSICFSNGTFKNALSNEEKFLNFSVIKNIKYDNILNSYYALRTTEQKLSSYVPYFKILNLHDTTKNLGDYFEILNNLEIDNFLKKFDIKNSELIEISKQIKFF